MIMVTTGCFAAEQSIVEEYFFHAVPNEQEITKKSNELKNFSKLK